jgi:uncharacterized protein
MASTTENSSSLVLMITDDEFKTLMNIRTITCFVHLTRPPPPSNNKNNNNTDQNEVSASSSSEQLLLDATIARAAHFLKSAVCAFTAAGYTVQTLRIATNPFGEWLGQEHSNPDDDDDVNDDVEVQLQHLDTLLKLHGIEFCALGPAVTRQQVLDICPRIVATSHRLSCSVALRANDVPMAHACASTIQTISRLDNDGGQQQHVQQNGLGNFRFGVAANCSNKTSIPFFPVAATCSSSNDDSTISPTSRLVGFAIGLENGVLANRLLAQCGSIENIPTVFKSNMHRALLPIQAIAKAIQFDEQSDGQVEFLGIDTSLNPSLHATGSIATAIEQLTEVAVFGGPGTIAAAAAITTCLQSMPQDEITCTGYCGLMLPVCEDQRLVQLASSSGSKKDRLLQIADLLSISSVCGVGIDTVPIAGDFTLQELTSLLLDVAGLAERWDKSLSCRVLPMPGKKVGDVTSFTSPYMMNTQVMSLL